MGDRSIIDGAAMRGLCFCASLVIGACATTAPTTTTPTTTTPSTAGAASPAATATPGAPPAAAAPPSPPVSASNAVKPSQPGLVFFDADAFDSSLGQTFADQPKSVHVAFAAPTSLNAIPPRINVWLTEIKKSNGHIEMAAEDPKAGPGRRGLGISMIFDIIDAVMTFQERQARAHQLATADTYDATIVYDKKTGIAKEVLFERRGI